MANEIAKRRDVAKASMKTRSEGLLDKLEDLMDRVTATTVTSDTVRAATDCADKAIQLMRLNFEAHKFFAEAGINGVDGE